MRRARLRQEADRLLDRVVADAWREQVGAQEVLGRRAQLRVVREARLDDLGVPSELDLVPGRWENDLGPPQVVKNLRTRARG